MGIPMIPGKRKGEVYNIRAVPTKRKCLKCGVKFVSAHSGNRRCKKCAKLE